MGRYLWDTSCLAAAASGRHEFHVRTVAELDSRARDGDDLPSAGHSLVEPHAVLTGLPSPDRLSAETAMALSEATWSAAEAVHLTAAETWRALRRAKMLGVFEGQKDLGGSRRENSNVRYAYPCQITRYEEDEFVVSFPDVAGANTSGNDRNEALEMAEDALSVVLAG